MDMGLRGQTVLITGGSKGIGLACAEVLAAEGCKVAIAARDKKGLESAAAAVKAKTNSEVATLSVNLASLDGIEKMVTEAAARLGRIDILVNNAGSIRAGAFL